VRTEIPGPSGGPVLGVLPAFRRDVLGCTLDSFRRYGDVVGYRFGPPGRLAVVVVGAYHPDDVHRVLTGTGHGFNRQTLGFEVMTEAFGAGLLTTEGDTWLRQRRTLQPLFTPRHVGRYAELMADEARRVVGGPGVADGAVVDLHRLMQRYTLRVVGRALFGEDVDEFVDDLYRLVPRIAAQIRARVLQVARLPLTWPTPGNRRFRHLRASQYSAVDRILTRRAPHPSDDDDDDLITRLRAARDPETGRPLSLQEVRDQTLIFLMAGHETTAGALTFTLDLLGRHPEVQDKVAAEEDLVRAALLEGMRLYPPAYVTERRATTDVVLGQHLVPRGTMVFASPWVTHRHPSFWPDPDRFDPTRFIGDQDRPRYAYFPFGGGPRSCIGEHFAMLEATLLLTALLARYRVEAVDRPPELHTSVTLRPAGPVRARLTRR
jgi:cytochrome P450